MTLNNSAISFATALGGVGGSVALTLGDYQALGICAPIFPLVARARSGGRGHTPRRRFQRRATG